MQGRALQADRLKALEKELKRQLRAEAWRAARRAMRLREVLAHGLSVKKYLTDSLFVLF